MRARVRRKGGEQLRSETDHVSEVFRASRFSVLRGGEQLSVDVSVWVVGASLEQRKRAAANLGPPLGGEGGAAERAHGERAVRGGQRGRHQVHIGYASALCFPKPPWRQPMGKLMVSSINSHTNATSIGWHLWEIDLRFAPGLPPGGFRTLLPKTCLP